MGNPLTPVQKKQLLAAVTEAMAAGDLRALAQALGLCKEHDVSTDEAMSAFNIGLSRNRLGL